MYVMPSQVERESMDVCLATHVLSSYIVPQDDHSPVPNIMPVPLSVQFTTLPDATPPKFSSGYDNVWAWAAAPSSFACVVWLCGAGTPWFLWSPIQELRSQFQ